MRERFRGDFPKVALIGCGQWGKHLARNLTSLGALRTICDTNPVLLEGVRHLYPSVQATTQFSEVLADSAIQGMVIATPPTLHYDLSRQALMAGKDVFVEKPLALEVRKGQELVACADGKRSLRVLEVLDACQRSLDSDGKPLAISSSQNGTYFAHETAVIDELCEIGSGTKIWHFSHVMRHARIGAECTIGQNVMVASDVTIGNCVKTQNNVSLYTGVTIEDDVFLGPSMVFTNVINPRSHISRRNEFRATLVRQGATIGANATVLCGHTVGRYALVGAGAVVTQRTCRTMPLSWAC